MGSKRSKYVLTDPKKVQNDPNKFKMIQKGFKRSKKAQNDSKRFSMIQKKVQNDPKQVQNHHKYYKNIKKGRKIEYSSFPQNSCLTLDLIMH